nr:MAG TPA: portal protein [Caudoviricetes sp.]
MIWNYLQNLMEKYRGRQQSRMLTEVMTDSRAIFTSFGNNIYMSDFVNNCIDRIATEISKVEVMSVVVTGSSILRQNDDISRLFRFRPNPLQTTKDFLSCCEWLRRKHCNCFIYPVWEMVKDARGRKYRRYKAFYPLNPQHAELGHFEDGRWAIRFVWRDGTEDTLPYDSVVHLRWRRGTSTLMGGGDDNGQVDDRNTMRSLRVLDEVMQGLPAAIKAGLQLNGILTTKTLADQVKLQKEAGDFESRITMSKSGIVAVDLAGDFTPINKKITVVPKEILQFLKDIIRERYGISDAIMSGDYNGDQHSAFYQSCIEDFIVEFEQAMSSRLFTPRERDVGHRIKGYYSKVEYFSAKDKAELATLATSTGLMTLNQVAELYGLPPFEGGDRRIQSLNYANTDIVDQYQVKNAMGKEKPKDGEE